jgi:hypothetical protein
MIRKKNNKPLKPSFAIVGEGKTEHIYFSEMRRVERLNVTIKPDLPSHPDVKNIIEKGKKLLNQGFDHVFCIFDLDRIYLNPKELKL